MQITFKEAERKKQKCMPTKNVLLESVLCHTHFKKSGYVKSLSASGRQLFHLCQHISFLCWFSRNYVIKLACSTRNAPRSLVMCGCLQIFLLRLYAFIKARHTCCIDCWLLLYRLLYAFLKMQNMSAKYLSRCACNGRHVVCLIWLLRLVADF